MKKKKKLRDPFYGRADWETVRLLALTRDCGDCVWCRAAGRWALDRHGRRVPVRATLVHHVKPRKEHPELALDVDNLVSLCDRCHDAAHPEKRAKMGAPRPDPAALAESKGIRVARL